MNRSRPQIAAVLVASVILMVFSNAAPLVAADENNQPETITQRVLTPDYTVDGTGVHVPGYSQISTPGAPQLPLYGAFVEVPLAGELEVSYELVGSQLLDQPVAVPAVPVPDLPVDEFDPAAEKSGLVPVRQQPDPAIFSADAFYPASPVEWDEAFRNGDQRLLPIRVYPFQVNPVSGRLRYHPDVRITIRVIPESSSSKTPGAAPNVFVPSNDPSYPSNVDGAVRVHTLERGMYRLTYSDLQAASVPVGPGGANPNTFAIYYEGQPVDIKVTGAGDDTFDTDDLVIFYAVPYDKRWQLHNVYWFTYGGTPSPQMAPRTVTPTGSEPEVTTVSQTFRYELQLVYSPVAGFNFSDMEQSLRSADDDHWLGERFLVNSSTPVVTLPIDLSTLDDYLTTGTLQLRAQLHRNNRQAAFNPDNSLDFRLNSHFVGRYQWDGETDIEKSVNETLDASWLDGSPNQLIVEAALSQIPGIATYNSRLDWIEITYPAQADAEGDNMYIESLEPGANKVVVTGFTTDAVSVYDLRDPMHPVELMTKQFASTDALYTLSFWDADLPDPTYYLSSNDALSAPLLVLAETPSNWRSTTHQYDYIALVPSVAEHGQVAIDIANAVQPLLDYRATSAGGGYRVAKVNVQDVFDEFGYGRNEPIAIREFLAYAYWNWNVGDPSRPQFVLFVGDSTTDTEGYSPNLLLNLMPADLGLYDPFAGEVPSDNRFVSVDLDATGHLDTSDHTPNMSAGRIPAQIGAIAQPSPNPPLPDYARAVTHVDNAVNKTLNYENGTLAPPGGWQSRTGFAAGNCNDPAGNLHEASRYITTAMPASGYQKDLIYYGSIQSPDPTYCAGSASSQGAFDLLARGTFDAGALYFQWVGHGSWYSWSNGPSFDRSDIDAMVDNQIWPLTAHYACATGDFTHFENDTSDRQTFGEEFLIRSDKKGSVVDYSGSGQHLVSSVRPLGYGTVSAIFQQRIDRAGKATDAGKLYYLANNGGQYDDVIDTMILFGDPATKLRLPVPLSGSYTFGSTPDWTPPGQAATFTLELINSGPDPSLGTQVTLALPDELGDPLWITSTASSPIYIAATREITWQGPIDVGETVTISFASEVSPTLTACGMVTVTGEIYDTISQVTTPISAGVNLAVPDVNCSSNVDIVDIQAVAALWDVSPLDPSYHPRYDLNGDGAITVLDLAIAAQAWDPLVSGSGQ